VYTPKRPAPGPRPCLYWMHGGGYMIGNYRMNEPDLDRWCETMGGVAVSVEYRLAPEHAYPAPLDDCYAGLRWVWEHANELGINRARLGIGGASAGGGLAAALALLARDRAEVPLAFQLLVYPMLDDRGITPSSQWDDALIWPSSSNRLGWECYLGDRKEGDVPVYAAAARATDLAGLPPAFVVVGGCDIFVDEDIDYAQRLLRAGVAAELHVYPGAPHGFDGLAAGTLLAQRVRHDMDDWFRRTLDVVPDGRLDG
jgi:acetyl esterase/lipase